MSKNTELIENAYYHYLDKNGKLVKKKITLIRDRVWYHVDNSK